MAQGRVKWYSPELGYGFILPDGGGVEVLVRHEEIIGDGSRALDQDTAVIYEVVRGREGPDAKNVSKVSFRPDRQRKTADKAAQKSTEVREVVARAQQKTIDEAAQKFAEVLMLSYGRVSDRDGDSALRINAELTRRFFEEVENNLCSPVNGDIAKERATLQHQRLEAARPLAEESVMAHMDFTKAIIDYYQNIRS